MKQVRETQAGKAISAYVVLKDGKICATIHAHYSKGGVVTVDVWEDRLTYQGRAGGYGYDKFTAALAGAAICGIKIHNHCETSDRSQAVLKAYQNGEIDLAEAKEQAALIGARFANGNTSLYYESGLEILRHFGYIVHQVI